MNEITQLSEEIIKLNNQLKEANNKLNFIAQQYSNAIHYCCRVDGDNWNGDFFGTLERTMKRHQTIKNT